MSHGAKGRLSITVRSIPYHYVQIANAIDLRVFRRQMEGAGLFFRRGKSRLVLRLQSRGEALRFRNPLDFHRDGVDRGLDSLQPSTDGAQLSRWNWLWLEPAGEQSDQGESQNDHHYCWYY